MFSRSFVNLFVSRAFFGVSAVDINMGYFVSQDVEINILKTVKSIASETYIVTDSQKFGRHSLTCSGPLNTFDNVICDSGMPEGSRQNTGSWASSCTSRPPSKTEIAAKRQPAGPNSGRPFACRKTSFDMPRGTDPETRLCAASPGF